MARWLPAALVCGALAVGACASESGPSGMWVREDGTRASDEAIGQAREACFAEADRELASSRSARSIDQVVWGRAVRKCMAKRGYVLVEVREGSD